MRVRGIPFRSSGAERRGGCCCSGVCSSTVAPVQQQQQVEKMHCFFDRDIPRVAHRVHDRLRAVSASHGTSRTVTVPLSASEQLPAAVQRVEPAMPSIHQNFAPPLANPSSCHCEVSCSLCRVCLRVAWHSSALGCVRLCEAFLTCISRSVAREPCASPWGAPFGAATTTAQGTSTKQAMYRHNRRETHTESGKKSQ